MEEIEILARKLKIGKNFINNIDSLDFTDKYEFVINLFRLEVEHRDVNRKAFLLKTAGFYTMKYMKDFDFSGLKLPQEFTEEDIISLNFIKDKENIIMYGNPGTGKTHLATAIGIEAVKKDFTVGFFRTAALVNKLVESKNTGELTKLLNKINKLDLLIMDEWGYIPLDKEGCRLLFQVVSDCYETKSIIITTNLEFGKWINIFYDKEMTAAMIDRLIHHSRLLLFEGESYRVKNSLIKK